MYGMESWRKYVFLLKAIVSVVDTNDVTIMTAAISSNIHSLN